MPRALKVFGGLVFSGAKERRVIVACSSQAKGAELVHTTVSDFRDWWCETGNKEEVQAALSMPGQVLMHFGDPRGDLRPVIKQAGEWVESAERPAATKDGLAPT